MASNNPLRPANAQPPNQEDPYHRLWTSHNNEEFYVPNPQTRTALWNAWGPGPTPFPHYPPWLVPFSDADVRGPEAPITDAVITHAASLYWDPSRVRIRLVPSGGTAAAPAPASRWAALVCFASEHVDHYSPHNLRMLVEVYRWLVDFKVWLDAGMCVDFAQHCEERLHRVEMDRLHELWNENMQDATNPRQDTFEKEYVP